MAMSAANLAVMNRGAEQLAGFSSQQAFTDLNSLQQLKRQGLADDEKTREQALRQAAGQFESIFIHMMLKGMRDANQVFAEGNPLNSFEARFHQQMLDQQLSVEMAGKQGLGIADLMVRQLSNRQLKHADAIDGDLQHYRNNAVQRSSRFTGKDSTQHATPPSNDFNSPADFVRRVLPLAEKAARRIGVNARALLAQSALETGWGKSVDGAGSHNNFFGIKSDRRWQGQRQGMTTLEYQDGVAVKRHEAFRVYQSPEDSFGDYADFILDNGRYQQAVSQAADPQAYVSALQDAGYATDPHYSNKVLGIMYGDTLNTILQQLKEESAALKSGTAGQAEEMNDG